MVVGAWWAGLLIPFAAAGLIAQRKHAKEQRPKKGWEEEKSSGEVFVCERVCTSKRMLNKMGAWSESPPKKIGASPENSPKKNGESWEDPPVCVTVCGVSQLDACADACARTVCANQHPLPNWNDICIKRCQSECLKLSSLPK